MEWLERWESWRVSRNDGRGFACRGSVVCRGNTFVGRIVGGGQVCLYIVGSGGDRASCGGGPLGVGSLGMSWSGRCVGEGNVE